MDDNVVQALNMTFAVFVFVIALSVTMFMLSKISTTAEIISFYSDKTRYYENLRLIGNDSETDDSIRNGTSRIVNSDTVVSTLYRYYKENFCVKIYDASDNLIQIFDVETEIDVRDAIGNSETSGASKVGKRAQAFRTMYNNPSTEYYLFGAPWIGSSQNENIVKRLDLYIAGSYGYINNIFVDYRDNAFKQALDSGSRFSERFISYSYTGSSITTEDGDIIVDGNSPKDKIVIIYKIR